MKTTGFGLSALLIAAGAILAWAVTYDTEGVDLNQVGVILFAVGIGLAILTLAVSATGNRTTIESQREAIVGGRPMVETQRDTIVERETQG